MGYRLSVKAEEDIIDNFRFATAQLGLNQAEHYHERLEQCFRFLADNPWVARERVEITRQFASILWSIEPMMMAVSYHLHPSR